MPVTRYTWSVGTVGTVPIDLMYGMSWNVMLWHTNRLQVRTERQRRALAALTPHTPRNRWVAMTPRVHVLTDTSRDQTAGGQTSHGQTSHDRCNDNSPLRLRNVWSRDASPSSAAVVVLGAAVVAAGSANVAFKLQGAPLTKEAAVTTRAASRERGVTSGASPSASRLPRPPCVTAPPSPLLIGSRQSSNSQSSPVRAALTGWEVALSEVRLLSEHLLSLAPSI